MLLLLTSVWQQAVRTIYHAENRYYYQNSYYEEYGATHNAVPKITVNHY